MNLFTRYLLRAHIGPFFFAFVALTGVILINTLAKELANLAGKGLPMLVVMEFFVLSLPANIALTLPMAVLVAVLYTFSTLAAENEITALRASGVDLRRVVLPLLVAAGLIAAGMIWFNDRVLPESNYRWRMLMTDVAQTRTLLLLEPQTINEIKGELGTAAFYLEAQEIDSGSGSMRNVKIYDVSSGHTTRTITADSGRISFDMRSTDLLLRLYDGSMQEVDFENQADFQTFTFGEQVMRMEGVASQLERTRESTFRTDRDMTLGMMQTRVDSLRMRADSLRAEMGRLGAPVDSVRAAPVPAVDLDTAARGTNPARLVDTSRASAPAPLDTVPAVVSDTLHPWIAELAGGDPRGDTILSDSAPVATSAVRADSVALASAGYATPSVRQSEYAERELMARVENVERLIREFRVEMHKKFAIASATMVFVLIGVPIALRFPRGGLGMVIAVSLSIFGVYYVGLIGGETLGDNGYVPPGLAMWATNIIFGVLGLIGFSRLGREQGTSRGSGWGELPSWLTLPKFRRSAPVEAP